MSSTGLEVREIEGTGYEQHNVMDTELNLEMSDDEEQKNNLKEMNGTSQQKDHKAETRIEVQILEGTKCEQHNVVYPEMNQEMNEVEEQKDNLNEIEELFGEGYREIWDEDDESGCITQIGRA